ncbi:ANL1P interacting protein [Yarrowia sp. B02]|nr:ANL1P interacting protein [Yarrowia sp. B02]
MNTIDQLFEQDFHDDWKDESSPAKRSREHGSDSPAKKVKLEKEPEDHEMVRMLERDLAYKSEPDDVNLATPNSLTPGSECDDKDDKKDSKHIEIIEIEDDDDNVTPPKIKEESSLVKTEEIHSSPDSSSLPEFLASTMDLPQPPSFSFPSSATASVSPSIVPSETEPESKQNMDKYLGKIFNLSPEDDFFALGGPDNSATDSFASVKELKQQLMSQHTLMTTYTSLKDVYQRVCKSLKERNAENRRLANHMKVLVGVIEQNNKKIAEMEEASNKLLAQTKTLDKEKKALQNTIKEMHKSTDGLSKIELLRLTINLRDAEIVRLKHKCGEL